MAVVQHRVKGGAHAEAYDGAAKEARKGGHVFGCGALVPRVDDGIQIRGARDRRQGAEEVRPDVDRLVVDVEEGAGAVGVGAADLAVAGVDERIVAAPGGEVVPELEEAVLDLVLDGLGGAEGCAGEGRSALAEG